MRDHVPEQWLPVLRYNNLDSFTSLWSFEAGWFEPPNDRRGGWSGVSRCELKLPAGGTITIFLKRQENHTTRTLRHPFGMATLVREMRNILRFRRVSVPTLEPVYLAERNYRGARRAILCTAELNNYVSLDALVEGWLEHGRPDRAWRQQLMQSVAGVMAHMHEHRIQHNCFYPKHVFVRSGDHTIEVRIIDLEKAKVRMLRKFASQRDLDTLNRHSTGWSRTDRLRFLLYYLGDRRLDDKSRSLWRTLARRSVAKGHV
jgi:hypothetical protein